MAQLSLQKLQVRNVASAKVPVGQPAPDTHVFSNMLRYVLAPVHEVQEVANKSHVAHDCAQAAHTIDVSAYVPTGHEAAATHVLFERYKSALQLKHVVAEDVHV